MTNKNFDTLRFIEAIIVPLFTFLIALTDIWHFPYATEIAATIAAVNFAFGCVIENLRKNYNKALQDGDS